MDYKEKLSSSKYKLTKNIMEKCIKYTNPKKWFKAGKTITVKNRMQSNYEYTLTYNAGTNIKKGGLDTFGKVIKYSDFNPKFTPGQMLNMGVFEGKYCNDQMLEFPKEWYLK